MLVLERPRQHNFGQDPVRERFSFPVLVVDAVGKPLGGIILQFYSDGQALDTKRTDSRGWAVFEVDATLYQSFGISAQVPEGLVFRPVQARKPNPVTVIQSAIADRGPLVGAIELVLFGGGVVLLLVSIPKYQKPWGSIGVSVGVIAAASAVLDVLRKALS